MTGTILGKLQKLTPAERLDRHSRLVSLAQRLLATVEIEKGQDGYSAYTNSMAGIIVGQGRTYEKALADIESAVLFHVETFGEDLIQLADLDL
jgi:predicted RNase H-like HicB family nuclease